MSDLVLTTQRLNGLLRRGINGSRHKAIIECGCRLLRTTQVIVGDDAHLKEVAARSNRGEGGTNAARTDKEDPHYISRLVMTCLMRV